MGAEDRVKKRSHWCLSRNAADCYTTLYVWQRRTWDGKRSEAECLWRWFVTVNMTVTTDIGQRLGCLRPCKRSSSPGTLMPHDGIRYVNLQLLPILNVCLNLRSCVWAETSDLTFYLIFRHSLRSKKGRSWYLEKTPTHPAIS